MTLGKINNAVLSFQHLNKALHKMQKLVRKEHNHKAVELFSPFWLICFVLLS